MRWSAHHDHNDHGHDCVLPDAATPRYRRVLWLALAINASMFAVEIVSGLQAGSVSLLADSVDFFGDAANYGLSLLVLGMGLRRRAQASLLKAASMALFGASVLGIGLSHALAGTVPEAPVMGAIGVLALVANLATALMLWRYREGDSNMRSVWLCSRNDAIGNLAVMAAALGVFGTGTGWPDVAVAVAMALLALLSAGSVARQALGELQQNVDDRRLPLAGG